MRKIKKIASILLAAIMVIAMAVPTMAATVEIADNENHVLEGHKFSAYQIFKGTQGADEALGDIEWGDGINVEGFLNDLVKAGLIDSADKTAKEVADVVSKWSDRDPNANKFAELAQKNKQDSKGLELEVGEGRDIPAGYYVIVDESTFSDTDRDKVLNTALLQVTNKGNFTIEAKTDIPKVDKEVEDEDEADDPTENGYGETADHEIGEEFSFRLTATIPQEVNFAAYDAYQVIFHDAMSKGITFLGITSVTINGTPIIKDAESGYTLEGIAENQDGPANWKFSIADIKKLGVNLDEGATIVVEYSAKLNKDAKHGEEISVDENNNDVYLEYSNEPGGEGTGKTKDDRVWVFTYDIPGSKVKGAPENGPLEGAGFMLQNSEGKWAYMEEGVVKWAEVSAAAGKTGEERAEILKAFDPKLFEAKSNDSGNFEFPFGLDIGEYTLVETTTPAGYNTAEDTVVTISATHNETDDGSSASAEAKFTVDGGATADLVTVENYKGNTLPETGGIGTTIFYVVGVILVLGAGVLLVTKKRMSHK